MPAETVSPSGRRPRRAVDPRQAVVDQMDLLVDEAEALGPLLGAMPDEFIHGRPFDGTATIGEMLLHIAQLDRTVRRANLEAYLSGGEATLQADVGPEPVEDAMPVADIVEDLAAARRELVAMVRVVVDRAWEQTAVSEDVALTPLEYLAGVIQHDAWILRAIAERVYESRPVGSPGLTSH